MMKLQKTKSKNKQSEKGSETHLKVDRRFSHKPPAFRRNTMIRKATNAHEDLVQFQKIFQNEQKYKEVAVLSAGQSFGELALI